MASEVPACQPSSATCQPATAVDDCAQEMSAVLGETVLHFDFDNDVLTPLNRHHLDRLADTLRQCPAAHITIAGNCDERGTEEYNLALGQRRADVAKKYLVALGVATDRVDTVSYGFERPADPRHDDEAWAMNRRDDFTLVPEAHKSAATSRAVRVDPGSQG